MFNGLAVSMAVHQLEEAMSASYGVPQLAGPSHPSHSPSGEQLEDIAISKTSQPPAILEEEIGSQNRNGKGKEKAVNTITKAGSMQDKKAVAGRRQRGRPKKNAI